VPRFRDLALRLILATGLAAALVFAVGRPLVQASLPLLQAVTDFVWPQYIGRVALADAPGGAMLQLTVTTGREIPLGRDLYVPAGQRIDPASSSLAHVLVPVVILAAALVAWPLAGRRDLFVRLLAVVPLALVVLALTAPFSLVGLLEIGVAELRGRVMAGGARETWPIAYLIFLESGGRWLLPIVLAGLTVLGGRFRRRPRPDPRNEVRYLGG
jgi:hypothetical protein